MTPLTGDPNDGQQENEEAARVGGEHFGEHVVGRRFGEQSDESRDQERGHDRQTHERRERAGRAQLQEFGAQERGHG